VPVVWRSSMDMTQWAATVVPVGGSVLAASSLNEATSRAHSSVIPARHHQHSAPLCTAWMACRCWAAVQYTLLILIVHQGRARRTASRPQPQRFSAALLTSSNKHGVEKRPRQYIVPDVTLTSPHPPRS
jgi:hypothetical protein